MNELRGNSDLGYGINNVNDLHSELNEQSEMLQEVVITIEKSAFTEAEKNKFCSMPTTNAYNEDGILTRIGDMQGKRVRGNGPGIVLLGYYNSKSERWAYAPNESGSVLDVDGTALQGGEKTWTKVHTAAKATGLVESVDGRGRKYLLIETNEGYVPARTSGDPLLKGWTTLDATIRVVFDDKRMPHPACENLDYSRHGFNLYGSRIWWPITQDSYEEGFALGKLAAAGEKLQVEDSTTLKEIAPDAVRVNALMKNLSAAIHSVIKSIDTTVAKTKSPKLNLGEDVEAQMYLKIAQPILDVYKEYASMSIEKKLRYIEQLAALDENFVTELLDQTAKLNVCLDGSDVVDFREATLVLEQFFLVNFKIMTKNGTETRAFIERPYSFWIDILNDIADDRQRIQSVETEPLADPLLRDLTKTFKALDQYNQARSNHNFSLGVTAGGYSTMTVGAGIGSFLGPIGFGVGLLVGGITAFAITTVLLITEGQRRKESSRRQPISVTTNRENK